MKFGIYSAQYKRNPMPTTASRTIYHDELRIAGENGNYALVAPRGNTVLNLSNATDVRYLVFATKGKIVIKSEETNTVTILDGSGRLVVTTDKKEIPVSQPGIYFVRITTREGLMYRKVLVD